MAGVLSGLRLPPSQIPVLHEETFHTYRLRDVPDDALASELMRRKRIQWYQATQMISQKDIEMAATRADLLDYYKQQGARMIAAKLLEKNIIAVRQAQDEHLHALQLTVALPVFIRTPGNDTKI